MVGAAAGELEQVGEVASQGPWCTRMGPTWPVGSAIRRLLDSSRSSWQWSLANLVERDNHVGEGVSVRRREPVRLPQLDYPHDPWRLVERRFSERRLAQTETLFSVANGYLGLRGSHEEGRPAHDHGTLVAGFHETWPIPHAEQAFGLEDRPDDCGRA